MSLLCEDLSELYSHFNEFRLNEEFCDVVIKVEERLFPCHRNILASAIEYFRAMFSEKFKEGEKKEIELKSIKADDFELLLTHVYGKQIKIKDDNAYRLLRISNYLGPRSLENAVVNYIVNSNSIPLNTALSIFIFACETKKDVLIDTLTGYIAKNFVTISKYAKFNRIAGHYLQQVLVHPYLDKDPTTMLDFFRRWVQCQGDEGKKFLPDLITAVNLSEVPKEWLIRMISNDPVNKCDNGDDNVEKISESSDGGMNENENLNQFSFGIDIAGEVEDDVNGNYFQPFLIVTLDNMQRSKESPVTPYINSYKFITKKDSHDVHFLKTEFEGLHDDTVMLFCKSVFVDELRFTITVEERTSLQEQYSYDCYGHSLMNTGITKYVVCPFLHYRDSLVSLKTLDLPSDQRIKHVAITANGTHIYVYYDLEFIMFNTQRNEWVVVSTSTSGHVNRDHSRTLSPNLLSYNGILYLIGGKHSSLEPISLNVTHMNGKLFQSFDPREEKWLKLAPMNYAHYKSASCIYEDKLYVSGGDYLAHFKGYIEYYDFKAGKWDIMKASMPEPKMMHTMLAHNNQLWFFGGLIGKVVTKENSLSWYAYDMTTQTWSNVMHMPQFYGKFETKRILDVVVQI